MIKYILSWFTLPEPIEQKQQEEELDKRRLNQAMCDEFFDFYIRIGGDVSSYDVEKVAGRFKY